MNPGGSSAKIQRFRPPLRRRKLEICALASGSKGNAVYVGAEGCGVLVDAGLPGRELERRLAAVAIAPTQVRAVVVSHHHRDHLAGVGVWARRYGVPVYATAACLREAPRVLGERGLAGVEVRPFALGEPFEVAGLEFLPFSTCHDAEETAGFRISDGASVLGFATDLGCVSHPVRHGLRDSRFLYLESNHDEDLLMRGPYPWPLKQRIRSRHGHLSNQACADLVAELAHGGLKGVILGHLSEVNNHPRLAYTAARQVFRASGWHEDVTLLVARQDRPGRVARF